MNLERMTHLPCVLIPGTLPPLPSLDRILLDIILIIERQPRIRPKLSDTDNALGIADRIIVLPRSRPDDLFEPIPCASILVRSGVPESEILLRARRAGYRGVSQEGVPDGFLCAVRTEHALDDGLVVIHPGAHHDVRVVILFVMRRSIEQSLFGGKDIGIRSFPKTRSRGDFGGTSSGK